MTRNRNWDTGDFGFSVTGFVIGVMEWEGNQQPALAGD